MLVIDPNDLRKILVQKMQERSYLQSLLHAAGDPQRGGHLDVVLGLTDTFVSNQEPPFLR